MVNNVDEVDTDNCCDMVDIVVTQCCDLVDTDTVVMWQILIKL